MSFVTDCARASIFFKQFRNLVKPWLYLQKLLATKDECEENKFTASDTESSNGKSGWTGHIKAMCFTCLCGLSSRTATIIVGILASVMYFLQLLTILLHQDFITAEFSADQFNAFAFNHLLLFLISILMLIGAIQANKWLLLPFIVFVAFQDLLSLLMTILAAETLLTSSANNGMWGLFYMSFFNCIFITWILWIVIHYFRILHYGYKVFADAEADSLLSQGENPLRREHALKPTVVSKLLYDQNHE